MFQQLFNICGKIVVPQRLGINSNVTENLINSNMPGNVYPILQEIFQQVNTFSSALSTPARRHLRVPSFSAGIEHVQTRGLVPVSPPFLLFPLAAVGQQKMGQVRSLSLHEFSKAYQVFSPVRRFQGVDGHAARFRGVDEIGAVDHDPDVVVALDLEENEVARPGVAT